MKEIKFRAWDNVNKVMQYSGIIWGDYDFPVLSELNYSDNINNLSNLMQYTGLKDKNGKEIYEGDIVKTDTENIVSIKYNNDFGAYQAGGFPLTKRDIEELNIEIIGNIYENPELLDRVEEVEEIPIMKGTREALDKLMI